MTLAGDVFRRTDDFLVRADHCQTAPSFVPVTANAYLRRAAYRGGCRESH